MIRHIAMALALGVALRGGGRGAAAQPSVERAITTYIDAHNSQALALLERVVNINSGTQNFAGVRQVGDVFRDELTRLGFKTTWIDGAAWRRAGHLTAEAAARRFFSSATSTPCSKRTVRSRSSSASTRRPRKGRASST